MKTVVITTPARVDRQQHTVLEMSKWGIPFEFYFAKPGTDQKSRALSNANAHKDIIHKNLKEDWIMILEDDVYFTKNPLTIERPAGYWQYYFGANITAQTAKGPNGWSLLQGAWGLYCVIWSRNGMRFIDTYYEPTKWVNPAFDDYCRGYFHLENKSLIYNEFIALTMPTFSDLEQCKVDYTPYLLSTRSLLTP